MYVPPPSELLPNRFVPLRSMDSSSKGFKPKLVSRLQQIELRVLPLGQGVEIFAFNVPLAPGSPMAAQGRVGRKRGVRRAAQTRAASPVYQGVPKRDGTTRCGAASLQCSSGAYRPPMSPRARNGLKGRNPQAYPPAPGRFTLTNAGRAFGRPPAKHAAGGLGRPKRRCVTRVTSRHQPLRYGSG